MQEDWQDEAEPLVWRWVCIQSDTLTRVGNSTEAAELGERTLLVVQLARGSVRAGEGDGLADILDTGGTLHARGESSAHVDLHVGRGTQERVIRGFGDWGTGHLACRLGG